MSYNKKIRGLRIHGALKKNYGNISVSSRSKKILQQALNLYDCITFSDTESEGFANEPKKNATEPIEKTVKDISAKSDLENEANVNVSKQPVSIASNSSSSHLVQLEQSPSFDLTAKVQESNLNSETLNDGIQLSNKNTENYLEKQKQNNTDSARSSATHSSNLASSDDDRFDNPSWEQSISVSDSTLEEDVSKEKNVVEPNYTIKKSYKKTYCVFCDSFIVSKHFSRHLTQQHKEKTIVASLLDVKDVKERKSIIATIRSKGNLVLKRRTGKVIPKKIKTGVSDVSHDSEYIICAYCKAFFKESYITRHNKKCYANVEKSKVENPKVESFIFTLNSEYQIYLKSDPLRKELLKNLRMDKIGQVVVSDPIILEYGIRLLQTSKNTKKRMPVTRNKMRECARLLLNVKDILPQSPDSIKTIIDILKPEYIDYLIKSVKTASNYSDSERSFGAASFALHQGKTIKDLIDIATYLICKRDPLIHQNSLDNATIILKELKILQNLVDKNWGREVGSLALKDLNVKKSRNHSKKLLPLTNDIMKLRHYCLQKGKNSLGLLKDQTNAAQYLTLIEVTFVLILLHNRKRVGDIQFIELDDVTKLSLINQNDEILESLSKTERILTKLYKKIHTIGKGSKELLILIPRDVQKFVDTLVAERPKYVNSSNKYFFCNPGTDDWINGCYVQAKYSKECGAKAPALIRSSRLRKHIATMMQLMDLRENEISQLSQFMGHTEKTHREFYRLPKDVMMVAKVSKILLKLEMGQLLECKNKSLDEVDVNIDEAEFSNSLSDADDPALTSNRFRIPIFSNEKPNDKNMSTIPSSSSSACSSENENSSTVVKKNSSQKVPCPRRNWSNDEISSIKIYFAQFLDNNSSYPNSATMKSFLDKNPNINRTVPQLRSKIQYLKKMSASLSN